MAVRPALSPEEFLAKLSPKMRRLAGRVRQVVSQNVNPLEEKVYLGWQAIGFRHPRAGYFCGIFPFENEVRIIFEHGKALSDPHGILTGDGKQIRVIPIKNLSEFEAILPEFKATLLESIDYGISRKATRKKK